jgi:LysR family transcriptional regulator, transcriptional activator for aaeXAB operon
MEKIFSELSVLSRAVAYSNLSGAAIHVGLSQPQLSRIIARLEGELGVVLLDREIRRKSSWTPLAHKLAEAFMKTSRNLGGEIHRLIESAELRQLRVGTLEGLIPFASACCQHVLEKTQIRTVELDVYDLSALEEHFSKGNLDLIFSFREPGRKKYRNVKTLGYQSRKKAGPASGLQVMSPFEFNSSRREPDAKGKVLVSNSLLVRKDWIENRGATGVLPSPVRKTREPGEDDEPVSVIGSESLTPSLWERISSFR